MKPVHTGSQMQTHTWTPFKDLFIAIPFSPPAFNQDHNEGVLHAAIVSLRTDPSETIFVSQNSVIKPLKIWNLPWTMRLSLLFVSWSYTPLSAQNSAWIPKVPKIPKLLQALFPGQWRDPISISQWHMIYQPQQILMNRLNHLVAITGLDDPGGHF